MLVTLNDPYQCKWKLKFYTLYALPTLVLTEESVAGPQAGVQMP